MASPVHTIVHKQTFGSRTRPVEPSCIQHCLCGWRIISTVSTSDWKKKQIPSNLQYKVHQIPKLKWFSSRLAVAFAQSTEARSLSREWRCSWSSADRQCSNYIWVISNFNADQGVPYIRGLMVINSISIQKHFIAIQNIYITVISR